MINRQWAHVWYSNRSKQHYFHRTTIHNRRFYMTQLIHLDGNSLTLEEVIAVARHGAQCELDEQAKEAVIASRKIVDDIVRVKRRTKT